MNIALIYRASQSEIYGPNIFKRRPKWYDKKKCFKSCYDAAKRSGLDFYFIYDGVGENDYTEYLKTKEFKEFIRFQNLSSPKTFLDMFTFLHKIQDQYTHFYICEDDYLHLPQSFDVLKEGISAIERQSFFTLFEHPDRYRLTDDITFGKEMISISKSSHWRTVESTCSTFCMPKELFLKFEDVLTGFSDRAIFRTLYQKGIRLWSPMPTMATHVESENLAPMVDWEEFNKNIIL